MRRFEAHLLSNSDLMQSLGSLVGERLICHCAPAAQCHGDVLIKHFVHMTSPLKSACQCTVLVGVHHTPEEFVEAASSCMHPVQDD